MSDKKRTQLSLVGGTGRAYPPMSAPPGGDPPDDMDRRLEALEGDMKDVRERLIKIESDLSHMPTTLHMWTAVVAAFSGAGLLLVGGLYWVIKTLIATPEGQAFLALLLKPPVQ